MDDTGFVRGELTRFGVASRVLGLTIYSLMEVYMQEYDALKRLIQEVEDDMQKALGGNKAAGTRVRKKMQEIKAAAQEVRKKLLEGRENEPGSVA